MVPSLAVSPLSVVTVALIILGTARTALAAGEPSASAPDAGAAAILRHLVERWGLVALGLGIVFIAFLINRYAPKKRRRIRRVVILFAVYLFCLGLSAALAALDLYAWSERLYFLTTLFGAYTTVNLIAIAVFDIALPAVRVVPVSITTDVLIGLAYAVTTVMVLRVSGVNTGSVLTTGAVVSGFVALSLQNTLSNIFGGLALQLDDSIHVGDWLQLENGKQGKVKEIRWRHTVIETRDWDTIVVPNSSLLSGNIMILGKREGAPLQHRMWVYFNVDFRHSPARVISVVSEALLAAPIERVAAEPKPSVICYDFAKDNRDSFAYYAVRYWLTDLAVDDPTSSAVRTRIYHALRRAGIPLALPATTTFVQLEDEEKRHARHRSQRMAAVRSIALFHPLKDDELETVAEHLRFAPFTAGEVMTRQGAVAHWLYIITAGRAEIRAKVEGVSKVIATLEAPTFFGEMGLMTGEPRSADVVALTEIDCYRLDKEGFEQIIQARPEIATEMSRMLAERRVELLGVREGLDAEAKRARAVTERQQILGKIQTFFGLGRGTTMPPPRT
ncbi:MAG: mechanosensitive ion channel family protein [Polyangiales bacterium]